MLEAVEMAICPECGGTFEPRHNFHQYDTDYCRRCAGRRRHGLPQWVPRQRRMKLAGTCRWCHEAIWTDTGQSRDYCDLQCLARAKAAKADAASMAQFLEFVSHPQPQAPNREYRVIDGFVVEVVWSGSMKRSLAE